MSLYARGQDWIWSTPCLLGFTPRHSNIQCSFSIYRVYSVIMYYVSFWVICIFLKRVMSYMPTNLFVNWYCGLLYACQKYMPRIGVRCVREEPWHASRRGLFTDVFCSILYKYYMCIIFEYYYILYYCLFFGSDSGLYQRQWWVSYLVAIFPLLSIFSTFILLRYTLLVSFFVMTLRVEC